MKGLPLPEQIAGQADVSHSEALALIDGDGDEHLTAIGRQGHQGGIHSKLQVALVQIEGLQRLDVAGELLARVLVGLGVPRHPGGGRQTKLVEQVVCLEGLRAHNSDLGDAGIFALVDGNRDRHAVAFQRRDGGLNLDVVLAAAKVLALQLLLGAVEQGAVKDSRLGQARVGQGLLQDLLVELLGATHLDCTNGWPLFDQDHQHLSVELHPHVLEEPRCIEQPDRLRDGGVGESIAHANGQVREHRARLNALQALHTHVLDHHAHRSGCTWWLRNGLRCARHLHLRLGGSRKHQQ